MMRKSESLEPTLFICPPSIDQIAPPDMLIAVGFGIAQVTRDDELVYSEPLNANDWDDFWTVADAEKVASENPNHDWRILMVAPLQEKEYQRQNGQWVLISKGPGFA